MYCNVYRPYVNDIKGVKSRDAGCFYCVYGQSSPFLCLIARHKLSLDCTFIGGI